MPVRTFSSMIVFVLGAGLASPAADINNSLRGVKQIFIESMGNGFEHQLQLEVTRQFRGALMVTTDRAKADAVLKGHDRQAEKQGAASRITGRFLAMNDVATGYLTLYDKDGTTILWMDSAGDRSFWVGPGTPESRAQIAERLVRKLRRAFKEAH